MTYNHEDWEVGDLAWITVDPDLIENASPEARDNNQGRELRMLTRQPDHAQWRPGVVGWRSATGWVHLRSRSITDAERAVALSLTELDEHNDRGPATVVGTHLRVTRLDGTEGSAWIGPA